MDQGAHSSYRSDLRRVSGQPHELPGRKPSCLAADRSVCERALCKRGLWPIRGTGTGAGVLNRAEAETRTHRESPRQETGFRFGPHRLGPPGGDIEQRCSSGLCLAALLLEVLDAAPRLVHLLPAPVLLGRGQPHGVPRCHELPCHRVAHLEVVEVGGGSRSERISAPVFCSIVTVRAGHGNL